MKTPEKQSGYESKEILFHQYVERGVEYALSLVKMRFEDTSEKKNRMPFHKRTHTREMKERAFKIASALYRADPLFFPERSIHRGILAAAYHDTVQNWVENIVPDGSHEKIMRRRLSGDNEKESAREVVDFMNGANQQSGMEIFTDEDKQMVHEAIMVTVPGFDPEKGTVIQPSLTSESGAVARVVALADLGAAGMDGPDKFLPEGDALFREENLDILDAMENPEKVSNAEKERYRKRMLGWTAFQAKFAAGRKELLEKELGRLPETAKNAVRELFNKFDASIEASEARTKRREKMTFEELAADMGYRMIS